ncbi:hypothetical protein DM02DRAFT_661597 [Periconia macrospinosa]|uniref:Uncharacterized protein n=1 Tax=Periconia macrospinosa TaxID=97972 RepID=A0A2V1D6S0_9PLEO|nr:hypothetical protein DM02DRAFT_661597 [Periconia macrospinosa]
MEQRGLAVWNGGVPIPPGFVIFSSIGATTTAFFVTVEDRIQLRTRAYDREMGVLGLTDLRRFDDLRWLGIVCPPQRAQTLMGWVFTHPTMIGIAVQHGLDYPDLGIELVEGAIPFEYEGVEEAYCFKMTVTDSGELWDTSLFYLSHTAAFTVIGWGFTTPTTSSTIVQKGLDYSDLCALTVSKDIRPSPLEPFDIPSILGAPHSLPCSLVVQVNSICVADLTGFGNPVILRRQWSPPRNGIQELSPAFYSKDHRGLVLASATRRLEPTVLYTPCKVARCGSPAEEIPNPTDKDQTESP